MNSQNSYKHRYSFIKSNTVSSNQLHFRNPWVVAWWSLAFPGFGHFMINSQLWGFILMSFEFYVNYLSNINLSIYHSMIGEFDKAKEVANLRWFFLYIVVYIFAVWDSYRRTIQNNKLYQLAYNDKVGISPAHLSAYELNMLEKKQPVTIMIWSFLMPGLRFIYMQQVIAFLFTMVWWIVILYFSHFLEGFYYTMVGEFETAKDVLNPQWALFLPSIYGYVLYHAYFSVIENNRLYDMYQARFLKQEYQTKGLDHLYKQGDM